MSDENEVPTFEEPTEIIEAGPTALAQIVGAEIDVQIATAHRFPRSIALSKKRMLELATLNQATAEKCGYALQRRDKNGKIVWIRGPSVRMAEIAAACWGNIRTGARVIDTGDKFVVAQGVCHDMETNNAITMESRRRITTSSGKRYGDDMIGMTANAAAAIAMRNAVFKIVPLAMITPIYHEAMKVAEGNAKTFTTRRDDCVAAFAKMGVTEKELLSVIDRAHGGIDDITSEDLMNLRGLYVAITDGQTTVDAVFRPQPEGPKASDLNAKIPKKDKSTDDGTTTNGSSGNTTSVAEKIPETLMPTESSESKSIRH
jgi:hypothetical protein